MTNPRRSTFYTQASYVATGLLTTLSVAASVIGRLPAELGGPLEVCAVLTGAWSVWFLARNKVIGWWIAIVSNGLFGVVFYRVELFAEVGIQVFYFVTGLQAIWLWLHAARGVTTERPVGRASGRLWLLTLALGVIAWFGLRHLLIGIGGAAPTWDSLTTVLSLAAHLFLMWRLVDSWALWILVDIIYVPLYVSRGLNLTAGLYVAFLLLSILGLAKFRRELLATRVTGATRGAVASGTNLPVPPG